MYLSHYGLEREPFTIAPDPRFLYPSPQHRQALAHLKYGLDREGGFILLTGEVGTGKTTLTRLLLEQLPGNVRVAYILNAKLDTLDVLGSFCQELGLDRPRDTSVKSLIDSVNRDLLDAHAQNKKTLLVVEEAQNLDPDVLETLRLLTNLETNTAKLLHILLVGQPELLDLLGRGDLRQLNQRVVSRFHLEPLSLAETSNYLNHRMRRGGCNRQVFDGPVVKALYRRSGGIPRVLNQLAERSLLGAYADNVPKPTTQIVRCASREVLGEKPNSRADTDAPGKAGTGTRVLGLFLLAVLSTLALAMFALQDRPSPEVGTIPLMHNTAGDAGPSDPDQGGSSLSASSDDAGMTATPVGENNSVDVQVSSPAAEITTGLSAVQQLLAAWHLEPGGVVTGAQLCDSLVLEDLDCRTDLGQTLDDIRQINRPGLVTVAESAESRTLYLVESIRQDGASLSNSSGKRFMKWEELERAWDGGFTYLWRPPAGYRTALYQGMDNADLVRWVQARLGEINPDYETIISGGLYSRAIAQAVAEFQRDQSLVADTVLGPRTLMRLMEQGNQSLSEPRLAGSGVSDFGDAEE